MAVPTWFRKGERPENPDDVPTGQIAASSIARIIDEVDDLAGAARPDGTEPADTASKPPVQPVANTVHSVASTVQSVANAGQPLASDAPAGLSDLAQALADRQSLIQLCFYAMDRARSGGVVERIEHGLAKVGVRALRPDGDRFDPVLHEAGSAAPTDEAALDGVVAETEVVGFADHERLLRAPIVTVYTKRTP